MSAEIIKYNGTTDQVNLWSNPITMNPARKMKAENIEINICCSSFSFALIRRTKNFGSLCRKYNKTKSIGTTRTTK